MRFPSFDLAVNYARARRFRTGRDYVLNRLDLIRGTCWMVTSHTH